MRRSRRAISQINVVPYIDVMLVLLVIFMVTAPFINPGHVELPSVGKSGKAPVAPLEVIVKRDGSVWLRDRALPDQIEQVSEGRLAQQVAERLERHRDRAVVISADKDVRYEAVMQVMDALRRAGMPRVGLLVKPGAL